MLSLSKTPTLVFNDLNSLRNNHVFNFEKVIVDCKTIGSKSLKILKRLVFNVKTLFFISLTISLNYSYFPHIF